MGEFAAFPQNGEDRLTARKIGGARQPMAGRAGKGMLEQFPGGASVQQVAQAATRAGRGRAVAIFHRP